MYHLVVKEIKRGFFGPKHKEIYNEFSYDFAPLAAEASKYSDSDWHIVNFKDMTEMYGYAPGRASLNASPDRIDEVGTATAWDFDGNPVEDDREKEAMREAERSARYYDEFGDELPF